MHTIPIVLALFAACVAARGSVTPTDLGERVWTNERFGSSPGFFGEPMSILRLEGSGPPRFLTVGNVIRSVGFEETGNSAYFNGEHWLPVERSSRAGSAMFSVVYATVEGVRRPVAMSGGRSLVAWDGERWDWPHASGERKLDGTIIKLYEHDDGSGSGRQLYAGGSISKAGDAPAVGVVRLTDPGWEQVGQGLVGIVRCFLTINRDGERLLLAGGNFTVPGHQGWHQLAVWDGVAWSPYASLIGTFNGSTVKAMIEFDDGDGSALYVGGEFVRAQRLDGTAPTLLGTATLDEVQEFQIFDDGNGPALHACGRFERPSGSGTGPAFRNGVARWNGDEWAPLVLDTDFFGINEALDMDISTIDGKPVLLVVGEAFRYGPQGRLDGVIAWDGERFKAMTNGLSQQISAIAPAADGDSEELVVAGGFAAAGNLPEANFVAEWTGSEWAELGVGLTNFAQRLLRLEVAGEPTWLVTGQFRQPDRSYEYLMYLEDDTWVPARLGGYTALEARVVTSGETSPPGGFAILSARFERDGEEVNTLLRRNGVWSGEVLGAVVSQIITVDIEGDSVLFAIGSVDNPDGTRDTGLLRFDTGLVKWFLIEEVDDTPTDLAWLPGDLQPAVFYSYRDDVFHWNGAESELVLTLDDVRLFRVQLDGKPTLLALGSTHDGQTLLEYRAGAWHPMDIELPDGTVAGIMSTGAAGREALWFRGIFNSAGGVRTSGIARFGLPFTTPCPADLTTDGTETGPPDGLVTLSDFSVYLSLWSRSSPRADVTTTGSNSGLPDGAVDLSDFSFYIALWAAGCP